MKFWLSLLAIICLAMPSLYARGFEVVPKEMKTEQRIALVIGNRNYTNLSVLKNPVNDASDMKKVLKKKGFEVIYLSDATQREMEDAIEKFSYKLKSRDGIGLFFYAGHGIEVDGINYLVPTNARIPSKKFVKSKSVSTELIIASMEEAKNRLNIVILDACRNDPFSKGFNGGLAPLNSASGIYVAYATAPKKVADDNRGERNGLFTKYLLKYINVSGLKIEDVFKKVRKDVKRDSNGNQTPWSNSSIDGDFYFTLPKGGKQFTPTFRTTPKGATVDIDGYGTWQRGMSLKKGTYTIRVSKSGYITQSFRIELKNSGSFALTINRESKPTPQPYIVKDSSAVVVIDGLSYQNQPFTKQDKENYDKNKNGGRVWDWKGAKAYCRGLTLNGYSDWRLPNKEELKKLLTKNKNRSSSGYQYYIRKEFVDKMPPLNGTWKSATFWTSTLTDSSSAWIFYFKYGFDDSYGKSLGRYVLCVRGQ